MSRTCGECGNVEWGANEGKCIVRLPIAIAVPSDIFAMSVWRSMDATNCACFSPRVCETSEAIKEQIARHGLTGE